MHSTLHRPNEPGPPLHVRVRASGLGRCSLVSKLSDSDFNVDYNYSHSEAEWEAEAKASTLTGEGTRAIAMIHDDHRNGNGNDNGRATRESSRRPPSYRRLQTAPARPSATSRNDAAECSPTRRAQSHRRLHTAPTRPSPGRDDAVASPGRRLPSAQVKRPSFSALRAINIQRPSPPSIVRTRSNRRLPSRRQQQQQYEGPPCRFVEMKTPKSDDGQELDEFRRRADPAATNGGAVAPAADARRPRMDGDGGDGRRRDGRRRSSHGSGVGQVRLNVSGKFRLSFRRKKDVR